MRYKYLKYPTFFLAFLTFSCTGVQEYVFPSLSDEEVVAPPALEEVPQTIETAEETSREIPPSQYAPPPVAQPQVALRLVQPALSLEEKSINLEQIYLAYKMQYHLIIMTFLGLKTLLMNKHLFIKVYPVLSDLDFKSVLHRETQF